MKIEEAVPGMLVKFNKFGKREWSSFPYYSWYIYQVVRTRGGLVYIKPLIKDPPGFPSTFSWHLSENGGGFWPNNLDIIN